MPEAKIAASVAGENGNLRYACLGIAGAFSGHVCWWYAAAILERGRQTARRALVMPRGVNIVNIPNRSASPVLNESRMSPARAAKIKLPGDAKELA